MEWSSADRGVPVSCVSVRVCYQCQSLFSCLLVGGSVEFALSFFLRLRVIHHLFLMLILPVTFYHCKIYYLSLCVSPDFAFLPCQGHSVSPTLSFLKRTFRVLGNTLSITITCGFFPRAVRYQEIWSLLRWSDRKLVLNMCAESVRGLIRSNLMLQIMQRCIIFCLEKKTFYQTFTVPLI